MLLIISFLLYYIPSSRSAHGVPMDEWIWFCFCLSDQFIYFLCLIKHLMDICINCERVSLWETIRVAQINTKGKKPCGRDFRLAGWLAVWYMRYRQQSYAIGYCRNDWTKLMMTVCMRILMKMTLTTLIDTRLIWRREYRRHGWLQTD